MPRGDALRARLHDEAPAVLGRLEDRGEQPLATRRGPCRTRAIRRRRRPSAILSACTKNWPPLTPRTFITRRNGPSENVPRRFADPEWPLTAAVSCSTGNPVMFNAALASKPTSTGTAASSNFLCACVA